MTERLRQLMEDASAQAPAVRLREDTWRRARRTRAVELVVVPVLAMALVMLGGLAVGLPGASTRGFAPADAERGAPALPEQLHAVPDWVEPSGDLAVGQLSVVWTQNGRTVVMGVRAEDGAHVALDLPDHDPMPGGFSPLAQDVALSPDGRRLAFAWEHDEESEGPVLPGGYAVLDLETGQVDRQEIDEGGGVTVEHLAWSADGVHLAYRVSVWDPVEKDSDVRSGGGPARWELVNLSNGRTLQWEAAKYWAATPTRDGGGLLALDGSRLVRLSAGGKETTVASLPGGGAEFGTLLLDTPVGILVVRPAGTYLVSGDEVSRIGRGDDSESLTLLGASSRTYLSIPTPRDPLVLHEGLLGRRAVDDLPRSEFLFEATDGETELFSLSLAGDLVGLPRRDFPAPDWPTNPAVYQACALSALLLLGILLVWRRRRQN